MLKGDIESTMSHSFNRRNTLIRWLENDASDAIERLKAIFRRFFPNYSEDKVLKGKTPMTGLNSTAAVDLLSAVKKNGLVASSRDIKLHANLHIAGKIYSRKSTHDGNSGILVRFNEGNMVGETPAVIKYIFSAGDATYLAVNRYKPRPEGSVDPFQHYPALHASIWSSDTEGCLEIIEENAVIGHIA